MTNWRFLIFPTIRRDLKNISKPFFSFWKSNSILIVMEWVLSIKIFSMHGMLIPSTDSVYLTIGRVAHVQPSSWFEIRQKPTWKKPWKRIEIFHEMVNLVPHIKNIVASPRFMLIQSDNQIISACQHTGIQIAQISRNVFKIYSASLWHDSWIENIWSEKFNEICLFDDKDAKQILIAIKRDEVKVLELNQCGFIVSDVFSLRVVF